jgi:hypothetical protein
MIVPTSGLVTSLQLSETHREHFGDEFSGASLHPRCIARCINRCIRVRLELRPGKIKRIALLDYASFGAGEQAIELRQVLPIPGKFD